MQKSYGMYQVSGVNLSVTDTGDFMQLRNSTGAIVLIHEVRVWQESDTDLAMNTVRLLRGVTGNGGSSATIRKYDQKAPTSNATAHTLPTTDVGSYDFVMQTGWNILQEYVWLPTPEMRIPLMPSDHFAVSLRVADTLTIGCTLIWEEFGAA